MEFPLSNCSIPRMTNLGVRRLTLRWGRSWRIPGPLAPSCRWELDGNRAWECLQNVFFLNPVLSKGWPESGLIPDLHCERAGVGLGRDSTVFLLLGTEVFIGKNPGSRKPMIPLTGWASSENWCLLSGPQIPHVKTEGAGPNNSCIFLMTPQLCELNCYWVIYFTIIKISSCYSCIKLKRSFICSTGFIL